jgi:hypothetical protein
MYRLMVVLLCLLAFNQVQSSLFPTFVSHVAKHDVLQQFDDRCLTAILVQVAATGFSRAPFGPEEWTVEAIPEFVLKEAKILGTFQVGLGEACLIIISVILH